MAEKAIGNLVVHMGLDDAQVRPTLKNIEQGIKAVDSAWKATYQSQKRVGDDLGAAKTKYDGLNEKLAKQKLLLAQQQDILQQTGKRTAENAFDYDKMTTAVGKSQAKVERFTAQLKAQKEQFEFLKTGIPELNKQLKQQQETTEATSRAFEDQGKHLDALKNTQNGYKQQMSTLNTLIEKQTSLLHGMDKNDNEDGYHAQEMRIASLRHEMSQLSKSYDGIDEKIAQQEDAEKHQGNTLADLRNKYVQAKQSTEVYTTSLVSQGRNYDALVAKQKGLKDQTQILTSLVEREQDKFQKMNSTLDSDAYHNQEMHVIQLKDKLRGLNSEFSDVTKSVHKLDVNPFRRFSNGAKKATEDTKETGITTKKIMFANLAGNAISSAWSDITGHIHEAVNEGKQYWIQQQKMLAVWTTLTNSASKGKAMVDTINQFSVKTGQAVDVVDELEQGFYHLHSSKKEADMLTRAMLNMGDTVGLTGQQLKAVGQDMTHSLAQGHLTTGALNQLAMYFPMVEEKLAEFEAKVHHKSHESSAKMVADLRKETKAGVVSAAAVEKLMDQLGNHKYVKAAENIMQTMFGMERAIKSRTPALIADIENPFMKIKSPIYSALAKWVSDKSTDIEFKKLGNSFALGASTISNAFAKAWHVNSFTKTADSGINALSSAITKVSNDIAKHAPQITRVLKDLGGAGADGLKIFGATAKDVSKIMLPMLNIMAKYPKISGGIVASLIAMSKAQKIYNSVLGVVNMSKTIAGWAAELLGIKKNNGAIALQNQELKENVRLKQEAAAASSGGISEGESAGAGNTGKVAKFEDDAKDVSRVADDAKDTEKVGRFARLAEKFRGISKIGKFAAGGVGILDVLNSATDLLGTNKHNVGSHVGAAAGSLGGTAAGAAIGTAIFPGIGTAVGAGLGGLVGEGAGRKFGKAIQRGVNGVKIRPPKMSMANSYNKLLAQGQQYYDKKKQQEMADDKLLYKNGDITKAEYEKRLQIIKTSEAKANTFTRAGEKGRNEIAKAYSRARQSLSESYNKKIMRAENKYGADSVQVEKLKDEKKKALQKQQLKYETSVTVKQAKLQTTLTGHIREEASNQRKIYEKLVKDKKKLSDNDMKLMVANSNDEKKKIIANANEQYNKTVSKAKQQEKDTIKAAEEQYKGNSSYAKQQRDRIVDRAEDQYDKVKKNAENQRNDSVSKAKSQYSGTLRYAQRQHKDITTQSAEQYAAIKKNNSDTESNYHLTWHGIWKTVGNWVSNMLHGLNNSAIKAQNKVFKQYGGSKTLQEIPTVAWATGTGLLKNGLLTKPVLATLNDGNDSPETNNKEIIAHANGNFEQVEGRNTQRLLEPGAGVFNAKESKLLNDLGLVHFDNGSGLFGFLSGVGKDISSVFKGIFGGLKDKLKAISKFLKNPTETFSGVYPKSVNTSKSTLGTMYSDLFDKNDKAQGNQWWNAAWNIISGEASIGGQGNSALLTEAKKLAKRANYKYSETKGRLGPNYYDCSGLVYEALKHLGITVKGGSTTVPEYHFTHPVSWKNGRPGDLAFFGTGGSQHVGIVVSTKGNGRMYSAENPSAGIKYGPIKTFGNFVGLRRISQLAGDSAKSDNSDVKASGPLQKLVKSQLKNSGVLAWVKKFLAPLEATLAGDIGSMGLSGSEKTRARELASAIRKIDPSATKAGIAAVLGNWDFESGLNPGIVNSGGGASGLGQWLGGRLSALKAYARRHHSSWKNAGTQLDFAFHGDGANSSILRRIIGGSGSVASLANRFSSQWERGGYNGEHVSHAERIAKYLGYENGGLSTMAKLANISEKNKPEMILPLTDRNRSVELIEQAKKMMGVPKDSSKVQVDTLVKLVAQLASTVGDLSKQLEQINTSIVNKPIVSDNMVGRMYDNYNKRSTLKKKIVRGEISL